MQDVATLEELKTAKNLTSSRSKIFLETRAYLRQSLSTLFDLDPLEIPIKAQPGEPPSLPSDMGNISLSHCKDAITIVWHKSKIGIDIDGNIEKIYLKVKAAIMADHIIADLGLS